MIYLSDDYLEKYSSVLTYLLGRSINHGYSYSFIERVISYSEVISEFEKSNVTKIAFSSNEKLYSELFEDHDFDYVENPYDIYGWLGFIYIHLFLKFNVTFEMLFIALPLEDAIKMYPVYHEMDISHLEDYLAQQLFPSSLSCIMKKREISTQKLADKTGISFATLRSLKLAYRDIDKLEVHKVVQISNALNVKIETLLKSLVLMKG